MSNTIGEQFHAQRSTLWEPFPKNTNIDAVDCLVPTVLTKVYGGAQIRANLIGANCGYAKLHSAERKVLIVNADVFKATSTIRMDTIEAFDAGCWALWSKASTEAFQKAASIAKAPSSAVARRRVERLTALQATLGLSVSDLANALGLSRPGLYKWLDVSNDLKPQGANRERLAVVERIAYQWRQRSTVPLSAIARELLDNGRTVLAMMVDHQIDEAAILATFDELRAMLAEKPKTRSQKLADAGFRRRPSVKSLQSDE